MIDSIKWLGHASFKIKKEKTLYIDPWKIEETEPADIMLISHSHFDHLSIDDVKKVQADKTIIITTADCAEKLSGNVKILKPGQILTIDSIKIEGIAAYNTNKQFHPKSNQWLGFVVTMNDTRIYYAGDTDATEEMEDLKDIDIAFLPIGGTYTMNASEAAQAANTFKPKIAMPYHYGDIVGSQSDAEKFKNECNMETVVMKPEK